MPYSSSPYDSSPYAGSPYDANPYARQGNRFSAPTGRAGRPSSCRGSSGGRPGRGSGGTSGRKRSKAPLFIVLGIVVALIAAVAVVGTMAYGSAQRALDGARSLSSTVDDLQAAVEAGDGAALQQATSDLRQGVDSLREELDGPIWDLAAHVPGYGGDVEGARELLSIADTLIGGALEPAAATLASYPLDSLLSGSSVNTAALTQYCSLVAQVEPAVDDASARLEALGTFKISQLNDVVDQLKEPLAQASELLDAYGPLVAQIPEVIGCNGSRTYLIIAQCNAEARATGGFPGAWGTVTVENGQATLGGFTTISGRRDVTFQLTDEEVALFGADMGVSPGNLNCTPDFPRAASLMAEAWQAYMGQAVDGVVAMDPVFVQDILTLVGGVTTSDGTVVDGTNAAQILSSDIYWRLDPEYQDPFFAEVAGLVADRVMSDLGALDLGQLLDVVGRDADEGRILFWSKNEAVQSAMSGMNVTGALPNDPAKPQLGVYVNDNTWAKMAWYLNMGTQVTGSVQNADGTVTYSVSTTLTNTFTLDEAAVAPAYIIGYSPAKRSDDDLFVNLLLVAPAGGSISGVTASSGAGAGEATLYGHDAWRVDVNLYAQESVTITYQVTVSAEAIQELEVHQTPLAQRW